jgi:hypothetical protein
MYEQKPGPRLHIRHSDRYLPLTTKLTIETRPYLQRASKLLNLFIIAQSISCTKLNVIRQHRLKHPENRGQVSF